MGKFQDNNGDHSATWVPKGNILDMGNNNSSQSEPLGSSCPIPEPKRTNDSTKNVIYNVYNEVISGEVVGQDSPEDLLDPRNNMPLQANQKPCPGQKELLSTERIRSNIPKGGTDSTWIYPSPQMFYNGMFY